MAVKLRMRRWLRILLVLSATILGGGVLGFFSLPWLLASPVLTEVTPLPDADVIVHWITISESRADAWVANLYQQGKAKKIVCVSIPISWDVYAADFTRQHLIALGVPADNVLTLHLPLEACSAPNDRRVAQYVKSQGWQSAWVVIDPMTAGSRLEKYFQQEGLRLALSCAQEDRDELLHAWWKTHWKIQWVTKSTMGVLLDSAYPECW